MALFSQTLFADAISNWRTDAENNDDVAQCKLGLSYLYGLNNVETNIGEGVKWIRKAANLGNAEAQYQLGMCYSSGTGVLKMPSEAVKWWYKSADQAHAGALYMMAVAYDCGYGGTKIDSLKASLLLEGAAKGGDERAQYQFGLRLYKANRQADAVFWLKLSAKQGEEDAKKLLQQISEQ